MGCINTKETIASTIISTEKIEDFFHSCIAKKYIRNSFSVYGALSSRIPQYNNATAKELYEAFIIKKMIQWWKTNPKEYETIKNWTMGQEIFVCDELTRSMGAHIIGDAQVFSDYKFAFKKPALLDVEKQKAWGLAVLTTPTEVLDLESIEPDVVKLITERFTQMFLEKMLTYPFDEYFPLILQRL